MLFYKTGVKKTKKIFAKQTNQSVKSKKIVVYLFSEKLKTVTMGL